MEKRTFERIAVSIECHCFNIEHFGTVINISEKGMFIRSQKISFPLESQLYIFISFNNEDTLHVRANVSRLTKSNSYYDGMAVELLEPSHKYLAFLASLRLKRKVLINNLGKIHQTPSVISPGSSSRICSKY